MVIMKKIKWNEVVEKVKKIGYDFDDFFNETPCFDIYADRIPEWEYGYAHTFEGVKLSRREFYRDFEKIVSCLYDVFEELGIDIVTVITQYNYRLELEICDRTRDIITEVRHYLNEKHVGLDTRMGFEVDVKNERNIIEAILEASFRDNLKLAFLAEKEGYIMEPTHHFNIVFYTKNDVADKIRFLADKNQVEMFMYKSKEIGSTVFCKYDFSVKNVRCIYCHKMIDGNCFVNDCGNYMCNKCREKYRDTEIEVIESV